MKVSQNTLFSLKNFAIFVGLCRLKLLLKKVVSIWLTNTATTVAISPAVHRCITQYVNLGNTKLPYFTIQQLYASSVTFEKFLQCKTELLISYNIWYLIHDKEIRSQQCCLHCRTVSSLQWQVVHYICRGKTK